MNEKYCCFDIGNVLAYVSCDMFLDRVAQRVNISTNLAYDFLCQIQKLHDLGLITLHSELVNRFTASNYIYQELLTLWDEALIPEPKMTSFLQELTNQGIRLALLSNIGFEHAALLDKLWGQEEWYQKAIKHYSCRVGTRKPHSLYYQSFLLQYPDFKGSFYFDDLQENLNASKPFGFETIRFCLNDFLCQEEKMEETIEKLCQTILD